MLLLSPQKYSGNHVTFSAIIIATFVVFNRNRVAMVFGYISKKLGLGTVVCNGVTIYTTLYLRIVMYYRKGFLIFKERPYYL